MFINRNNLSSIFYDYPSVPVSPSEQLNLSASSSDNMKNDIILPPIKETYHPPTIKDSYVLPVKREPSWLIIFIFILIGIIIACLVNLYIKIATIDIKLNSMT